MTETDFESLLKAKTKSLEYLRALSRSYIKEMRPEDTLVLDRFEKLRTGSFRALELFDQQLTAFASHFLTHPLSEKGLSLLKSEYRTQERLVEELITLDKAVLDRIEHVNRDILKDLKVSEKNRKTLSKFKSTIHSLQGEELDQSL